MSKVIYWIWLSFALGFSSSKLKTLIKEYDSAENIYHTDINDIKFKCELSHIQIKALSDKSLDRCQKIIDNCRTSGIYIVAFDDERYPDILRNIQDPPACLYCKGILPDFDSVPTVCLVGTRNADEYSCRAAWSLSARLTLANVIVISGGAVGIDSSAHRGCLDVGGRTVALLPCGLNYPYLKANFDLRQKIAENGCLISEYPPDYPVYRHAFHQRNRIMSGLSLGTVVIEAGEKSGALITARNAAEQGRDVFVVTGKPNDKKYAGSNMLLRDGAIPIFSAEDIVSEYVHLFGNIINIDKAQDFDLQHLYRSVYGTVPKQKAGSVNTLQKTNKNDAKKILSEKINETLSKNAEIVYNYINNDFFTVDDLVSCGLSINDIFSALTELELSGLIVAVPGGRYSKSNKENSFV